MFFLKFYFSNKNSTIFAPKKMQKALKLGLKFMQKQLKFGLKFMQICILIGR